MKGDKLLTEVVRHSLTYISEEMGVALRKSAYSPNIRERADHSCAILDTVGRTIGQAEHIPVHIGSFPLGLRNTLQYLEKEKTQSQPGDMFIVNDPYISGTHLNDVTVIRPVFLEENIIGYTANKAHHVDVGGSTPASINPLARDISEEGIIIEPSKLMEQNGLKIEAAHALSSNSRMPEITLGDLRAQIAANLLGEKRLLELVNKIGESQLRNACEAILDDTYRMALAEYAKMPEGTWDAEDYLELGDDLLAVHASISLSREGVEVDFTGSERQVNAPLNAVLGVTTAAVTFAVKTLLPTHIPLNEGLSRTIRIYALKGSIVNPVRPAPVAAGNLETSQRIVDVIYKALAKPMPDRVPAGSHGSMNNLMMGGVHPASKKLWAFYETIGGGYGGRRGADGIDGVQVNMTNTLNTPIEVMEHYYPIKFEAYRLRDGSCGLGEWRGGVGIERTFTAKARIQITVLGDRGKIQPAGLKGGLPGKTSDYVIIRANGQLVRLKSKDAAILEAGDVLSLRTAGGGGYGDPRRRSRLLIELDVGNQYITDEQIKGIYGLGAD